MHWHEKQVAAFIRQPLGSHAGRRHDHVVGQVVGFRRCESRNVTSKHRAAPLCIGRSAGRHGTCDCIRWHVLRWWWVRPWRLAKVDPKFGVLGYGECGMHTLLHRRRTHLILRQNRHPSAVLRKV